MKEVYVEITERDMDSFLRLEKGWKKNISGYEFVYDYTLENFPAMIKVLSSVRIPGAKSKNRGSDEIRVYSVKTYSNGKVKCGLIPAIRISKTTNWRNRLFIEVVKMIKESKQKLGAR